MRFVFCFLLVAILLIGGGIAQADPIYNTRYSSDRDSSSTIYNSRGTGASQGGPIMLKNMLRAPKKNTVIGKSDKAYSPYNMGGRKNGYALSMTPDQVREKQARDRARAKERAKELERQRKARKLEKNDDSRVKKETQDYTSRFRDSDNSEGEAPVYSKKRKRSVYVRDRDGLTTPEKVFNSIY